MKKFFICIITAVLIEEAILIEDHGADIELEVTELVEMVPFEKVMALAMEYAISDPQVMSLLGYLSGPKFKENVVDIENSDQFAQLADVAQLYHIDVYALANKMNRALDMRPVKEEFYRRTERVRRAPGEGVVALVKDAMANVPLAEIKEAYIYKIENNPKFKDLMDRLLSGEARVYLDPLFETIPFVETKKDLEALGLPLTEIQDILEKTTVEFFDLESTSPSPTYKAS